VNVYRPFIDDPRDIARFDGRRYVVLRPNGALPDVHGRLRSLLEPHLARGDASFPAHAHVTLSGFPKGTPLESVRDVVAQWARSVDPLRLEIERAGYFPAPFQIVMLQIRKTTELAAAMASLRARAKQRGLDDEGSIPASDWIFHMSLAYCSSLRSPEWAVLTEFVDGVSVPAAHCVVGDVEIVAFDNGQEYSGGSFELSASVVPSVSVPDGN